MRRLALPGAEPRGALVVDLDLPTGPLRLVAAHLGLLRRSRRWQVRSILDAIEHGPRMPILLVGDLNEWRPGRKSSLHELRPVFGPLSHSHFSFPSYFPVVALDRVIGSPGLVTAMAVHDSKLAQVASDHLPLKATIDIAAALKEMRGQDEVSADRGRRRSRYRRLGRPTPVALSGKDGQLCRKSSSAEDFDMAETFVIAQGGGPTAVINQTVVGRDARNPQAPSRRARARRAAWRARRARRRFRRAVRRSRGSSCACSPARRAPASDRHATSRTPPIASSC